ncbi:MAG: hypothetical protein ABJ387_12030 [Balneola sp.]
MKNLAQINCTSLSENEMKTVSAGESFAYRVGQAAGWLWKNSGAVGTASWYSLKYVIMSK